MPQLELHPLCTLFPRLTGADFDALRDDIAANGLRQPIVMHGGMILDGGNRYAACLAANVKPTFIEFRGDSIGAFVLSANMLRRHLSAGQQAAIVASVQDWGLTQQRGGNGSNQHSAKEQRCNVAPLQTVAGRMAQSGASERTQKMADKVAKASPELSGKVARGEISLPKAAKQIEPAKPAPKPAKPAKNAPTIEQLQTEVESLRGELMEAHDIARDLAHQLESYETASGDVKAAAKELTTLKGMLHTVETQRDSYMTKCNEMVKSVTYWKRKAGGAK